MIDRAQAAEALRLLRTAADDGVCSGAAVGVIDMRGERWCEAIGTAQSLQQAADGTLIAVEAPPISVDSLFDVASLTKPMVTSTLIARALMRGSWSLSDPIARHWPAAAGQTALEATVGQLMSHCAGLQAWVDFYEASAGLRRDERARAIKRAVMAAERLDKPGQAAVYSDLGFMILGWALEHDAGLPLDELFERDVRSQLDLKRAGFRRIGVVPRPTQCRDRDGQVVVATEFWPARLDEAQPLCGVVHDDNCAGLEGVAGHAGLFASVGDVLTWAHQWLLAASGIGSYIAGAVWRDLMAQKARQSTTWRGAFDTASPRGSSAGAAPPPGAFGHLGFTGTSVWISPGVGAAVLLTNRVHPSRETNERIRILRPQVHDWLWRALG